MEMNIPAPEGSTESDAPQVTAQTAEQTKPQAETPAGEPQAEKPDGEQQDAASDSDQSQDNDDPDKPKTWKEKRQERNRQRWQDYKAAKEIIPARLRSIEQQIAQLNGKAPPDFSQFTDPTEELAERTAWKVQQSQTQEKAASLEQERTAVAQQQQQKMLQAWEEIVTDAKDRIPNFMEHAERAPIHERAAPFIVESEKAAELAYWLGDPKNAKAAQDLYDQFASGSVKALIELGKLEQRLSAPSAKKISTAPKPASTLGGGVSPLVFNADRASADDMAGFLRSQGIIR